MRVKFKHTVGCLFLLASTLWLAGCMNNQENAEAERGSKADDPKPEMITVVTNRTDLLETKYPEYAKLFQQKYPSVTVRFEALHDYDRNIKIRLASNEMPDLMLIPQIPNSDLPKFYLPLDDLKLDGEIYFPDYKKLQGVTYGIPSGVAVTGVIYNKKTFETAGITHVPQTLDEFYEVCEKLRRRGIVPLASNFKDRWPLNVWSGDVPLILSGTGSIKNQLAEVDRPFQPGSPYVQAVSIIKTMYQRGYLEGNLNDTNWERSKKEIAQGKSSMMLIGNWVINQLIENGAKSEELGFFPFPADNSGVLRSSISPDRYYGIAKNTKHPDAAKAFLKWLVEESGYDDYAGFIPVLKNKKSKLPQLMELDSYQPEYVESQMDSDPFTQIQNRSRIELQDYVQDYILGNPAEVLEKYNRQWSEARKALNMGNP